MARVPMLRGIARDLLRAAAATAVERLGGEPASALVALEEEVESRERECAGLREQLRVANDPAKLRSLEALASADADRIKRLLDALAHEVEVGASRATSLAASVQIGKETAEAYAATVARLVEVETALAEERVKSERGLTCIGGYFPKAEAMVARADAAEARVKELEADLEKAKSGCCHLGTEIAEARRERDALRARVALLESGEPAMHAVSVQGRIVASFVTRETAERMAKGSYCEYSIEPLFRSQPAAPVATGEPVAWIAYVQRLVFSVTASRVKADEWAGFGATVIPLYEQPAPTVDLDTIRRVINDLGRNGLANDLRNAIGDGPSPKAEA